jgi:hypothetical protein
MGLILFILCILGCFLGRLVEFPSNLSEETGLLENSNSVEKDEPVKERIKNIYRCIIRVAKLPIFWILFLTFACGSGNGLMYTNNVGNLIESINDKVFDKNYLKDFTSQCISIYSVANGLGRILMGFSDYAPFKRGYFVIVALIFMTASQLISAFLINFLSTIRYTSALVGLSYGMVWSITPTLVSEIFGPKEFALIWGWFALAPTLGSVVFNSIAGKVYQSHVTVGKTCFGSSCYFSSFIYNAIGAVIGALVGAVGIKRMYNVQKQFESIEHSSPKDGIVIPAE